MIAGIPAYFDLLIEGYRRGWTGRNVHLGYWDDPPSLSAPLEPGEFDRAQNRLTELILATAEVQPGFEALDVGCGFGGLLAALASIPEVRLTGLGNDARQLDICRSIAGVSPSLSLVEADACEMPFPPESFDRVLCVEAMFHFRSRAKFFAEAARVLKTGGKLIVTDILLSRPEPQAQLRESWIEAVIRADYGPWPRPWTRIEDLKEDARAAGLALETLRDITRETLPSYRMTAPRPWDGDTSRANAGSLMRWLHERGALAYPLMRLRKA